MTEAEEIPTVTHEGKLTIGNLTIRVFHLSNGQRVIPQEDFEAFMTALEGDMELSGDDAEAISRLLAGLE